MKNKISFLLSFGLLLIASSAHAQPQQTWVSGVGDDFNPCSRTAPCLTLAGAISKTAAGGEISVLDPANFNVEPDHVTNLGAFVITKSITINGGSMLAGIHVKGTDAVIVNVTAPGDPGVVILRGLSINGAGGIDDAGNPAPGLTGIRYLAGAKLVVENCSVYGFTRKAIHMSPASAGNLVINNTTLTGPDDGTTGTGANGLVVANAATLHVEDSVIQGFGLSGLVVESTATGIATFVRNTVMRNNGGNAIAAGKAVFENCNFERNIIGMGVSQGAKATLHNCVIAGHSLFGLYCHDVGSQVMVDGCQISNNLIGIQAEDSGQVRASNSNINNNTTGLSAVRSGQILSRLSLLSLTNTVSDNGTNGAFTGTYAAK